MIKLKKLCRMYPNLFKNYTKIPDKNLKDFVKERLIRTNKLKGGYGDKLKFEGVSLKELDMGINVEYEHTRDLYVSIDIAFDHLAEIPDYYTRLGSMEKQAERYWKGKNKVEFLILEDKRMFRDIK